MKKGKRIFGHKLPLLEELALGDVDEHTRRDRGPEGEFVVVREHLPIVVRFRPHSEWGQLKVHRNRLEVC